MPNTCYLRRLCSCIAIHYVLGVAYRILIDKLNNEISKCREYILCIVVGRYNNIITHAYLCTDHERYLKFVCILSKHPLIYSWMSIYVFGYLCTCSLSGECIYRNEHTDIVIHDHNTEQTMTKFNINEAGRWKDRENESFIWNFYLIRFPMLENIQCHVYRQ